MKTVHFAIFIHSHQPVGNFDHVFHQSCDRCYQPLLETLASYPEIRLTMHFSGSLLEWIEANRPEISDYVAEMVRRGQIELMGGGYYEPILTMLTEQDRQGQLRSFSAHLRRRYNARVRGAWLTERVWEQSLVSSLGDAGIEYTALDDSHFHSAGIPDSALTGSFITEDQGNTIRVFPGSERLRYIIPFHDVDETIGHLRGQATEDGRHLVTYADDGEKFGIWPKTFEHVYEDGWLRRWLDALRANAAWIRFVTGSEAVDRLPPAGKAYLPDGSYREMTEWALPVATLTELEDLKQDLDDLGLQQRAGLFMRGGTWRNFRVKYPELSLMYAKMMRTSAKVNAMTGRGRKAALTDLYRGQCNCAYWHGVFGGLYLPHLRRGVKAPLIRAEAAADRASAQALHPEARTSKLDSEPWPRVETGDFDYDGHDEISLVNPDLRVTLKPSMGGHVAECSSTALELDLVDTLARRKEAYHRNVFRAAHSPGVGVKSIHDISVLKEKGLEKLLQYDWYPRRAFMEHFLGPGADLQAFVRCEYHEVGDFTVEPYVASVPAASPAPQKHRGHGTVSVALRRNGGIYLHGGRVPVMVEKTISLPASGAELSVRYVVAASAVPQEQKPAGPTQDAHLAQGAQLPQGAQPLQGIRFAVQVNASFVSGGGPGPLGSGGCYYRSAAVDHGNVLEPAALTGSGYVDLVDEVGGFEIHLGMKGSGAAESERDVGPANALGPTGSAAASAEPAEIWVFPVQTVSQSESGFERVLQSVAIVFVWPINVAPGGPPWCADLCYSILKKGV